MAEKILTESALEGYRVYTETTIAKTARFRLTTGGFIDVPVQSITRLPDNRVAVTLDISPEASGKVTIAEVQLLDWYGRVWATTKEQVTIENVQEGVLWQFTFNIVEQPLE